MRCGSHVYPGSLAMSGVDVSELGDSFYEFDIGETILMSAWMTWIHPGKTELAT